MSFIFVLGFLSWLQGNFLYTDYGPLDGTLIKWDYREIGYYLNMGLWLLLITIAVMKSSSIYRYLSKAALIFLLTLFISFVINLYNYKPVNPERYSIDETRKFSFSSDKNVILILLDEFQSDLFYELVLENDSYKQIFDGFTYYPDAVSGYPQTRLSLPLLLTGKYYYNSVPFFHEYIKQSYIDHSLPSVLMGSGYRVDLFPKFMEPLVYKHEEIASNMVKRNRMLNLRGGIGNSLRLIDLSLFVNSPTLIKKFIYNDNTWLLMTLFGAFSPVIHHSSFDFSDAEFLNQMSSNTDITFENPVFKFYHLEGAHVPYNKDSDGNIVAERYNRKSYKDLMTYGLKVMGEFLDNLKSKGLYDNTLIYIASDHGGGRSLDSGLNVEIAGYSSENENGSIPVWIKSRAIPLVMIKGFNKRGVMQVSKQEISISNIPRMILNDIGIDVEIPKNDNSFETNNELKGRKYLYYNFSDKKREFMPPLYEYNIQGFSWLDSSWTGPNKVYIPSGVYSKIMSIRRGDESGPLNYKLEGWITGNKNQIKFGQGRSDLVLKVDYRKPEFFVSLIFNSTMYVEETYIYVYINDKKEFRLRFENIPGISNPILGFTIEKGYLEDDTVKIGFEVEENSKYKDYLYIHSIDLFELRQRFF